ncbi:MAG: hemolysin family protein [bacterium]|nr:hemolysin family protein [bacterium]
MELIYYLIIFFFILLAGYFSGTETAIITANKVKLKSLDPKMKSVSLLSGLIEDKNKTLSAILVGTNISMVVATSLTSMLFIRRYGENGEYYATLFMTIIILIFGEILPKAIFRKIADSILIRTVYLLNFFITLFNPIIRFILFVIRFIPGFQRFQRQQNEIFLTREDLKNIFHMGLQQGLLQGVDKNIFYSIFSFSATFVREIMVPLVDIIVVKIDRKVSDVIKLSEKFGYTRVPVYKDHVYNIIGSINIFDLFKAKPNDSVEKYLKPAFYVPETKKIDDLFIEMNNQHLPIVFIVDEYGGVSGMVTLEDIIEEIVGEISQKPLELGKEQLARTSKNEWEISGDFNIDELYDKIGLSLPKKGFETVTGFIEYYLGKIPRKNENFIYNNYEFIVKEVSATSIITVKIKKLKEKEELV